MRKITNLSCKNSKAHVHYEIRGKHAIHHTCVMAQDSDGHTDLKLKKMKLLESHLFIIKYNRNSYQHQTDLVVNRN